MSDHGFTLRTQLKDMAETIKIQLSTQPKGEANSDEPSGIDDDGEEIEELDFSVTLEEYEKIVSPIFQKAIDIANNLITRNNLTSESLDSILMVGGPTFSQTLRRMMSDQFTCKVDTSVDPMTSVARGAALFASTISMREDLKNRDKSKIQLNLKYPETTIETEENLGVLVDRDQSEGDVPDHFYLDVVRSDKGWASGKIKIEDAEIVEVQLVAGKPNVFEIALTDAEGNKRPCEPSQITIIQGLKAAKATLPHSICIESVIAGTGKQRLVGMIGLEKNNTLPAKGKGTFKTQKIIRPGNETDVLQIPIVEGEPNENAKHNNLAAVVRVSGADLPALLPAGTEVELTLNIDESRRIKLSAYFAQIDESFDIEVSKTRDSEQKEIDPNELCEDIRRAQVSLTLLKGTKVAILESKIIALLDELDNAGDEFDRKAKVLSQFKTVAKEIDMLEDGAEWPAVENKLNTILETTRESNDRYGDEETTLVLQQFEGSAKEICARSDIKLALELIDNLNSLHFSLIRKEVGLWVSYIKSFDVDFDGQQWSDIEAARSLVNEAKEIIATQPSREKLEKIVFSLFKLLPAKDQPISADANTDLLLK